MGCGSSKVDELPVVSLCRERNRFIEEAVHKRYALAAAHVSYARSLRDIGVSLQRFFDEGSMLVSSSSASPSSPVLTLPPQRKADPVAFSPIKSPPVSPSHSHSHSGSHLHFHSDSDADSLSNTSSPIHETLDSSPPHVMHHYMRSRPVPSVAYEQKPHSPEIVRSGETYSSHPSAYSSNYGINSFFGPPFYSSSPLHPGYAAASAAPPPAAASSSESPSRHPPPPPPSPPRNSPWDFLNPFDSYESYYPPYTPKRFSSHSDGASRDSKEVREEEGIPDLEDDLQHEVVKEVHVEQRIFSGVPAGDPAAAHYSRAAPDPELHEGDGAGTSREALYQARSSSVPEDYGENGGLDFGERMVDKTVIADEELSEQHHNVAAFSGHRPLGVSEVAKEIRVQFERASDSGNEVAKMLEAGKQRYHHRKSAVYKVSARMLDVITPPPLASSQSSTSKRDEPSSSIQKIGSSSFVDFEEDLAMRSGNLSTTLEKILVWEKKLCEEVKVGEKMRIIHDRNCKRLKHLDERGAESHKIDATQSMIRDLSTKIRIAIQVVHSISNKINKLRDEELWPQISELIQGLIKMWKVMLECHQNQCQIITEARNLDLLATGRKPSEAHMEATAQLELELHNWILSFSTWITTQKDYVKALNSWLLKCLLYEPEETPDGIVPFSPGRVGAPPMFVICNHWCQAMESISEREVVESIHTFTLCVRQLREQHNAEQRQGLMAEKDMERRLKALQKEDQKMNKALDVLNKKLVMVSGHVQADTGTPNSLHLGLKQIFEAMSKFTASCLSAYEELRTYCEGDRIGRENKVP